MGALALLALFGVAGALVIFSNDDDHAADGTEDINVEGAELEITQGGSFTGTNGDDTVSINDADGNVSLDTGAGDDVVTGSDVFEVDAFDATITTGAGDDFVDLNLDFSTVQGGDGNDTINVEGGAVDVFGNAGDDFIEVSSGGDGMAAYGGDGNDTLQSSTPETRPFAESNDNVTLNGGAGDDLIYLQGPGSNGAGFISVGHGDAGNDTIFMTSVHASHLSVAPDNAPVYASGGEGQDVFSIRTHDVIVDDSEIRGNDRLVDHLSRDGVLTFELFEIEDFEPSVDVLSIDADAITDTGTLAAVRLEESVDFRGDPLTDLILTYENSVQQPVQLVVTLRGTIGVTWDDVEFVGEQTPVLTPIA